MKLIDTSGATWSRAKKTQGIIAMPVTSVFNDQSLLPNLLLETLEGKQPIGESNLFCRGQAGDVWQQKPAALFKRQNRRYLVQDGQAANINQIKRPVQHIQSGAARFGGARGGHNACR